MSDEPRRRAYDRDRTGEYVTWRDLQELMERHTESERTLRHGLRNEIQAIVSRIEASIDTVSEKVDAGHKKLSEKIDHLLDPAVNGHGKEHKMIEAERNQRIGMMQLVRVLIGANVLAIIAAVAGIAKAVGWL